jgi:acetoin utilization deacetylase AcuC-like enzyme
MGRLEQSGLLDRVVPLRPSPATEDDLRLVHSAEYVQQLQGLPANGIVWLDADTYMNARSYEVACLAAGGAIRGVKAVLDGETDAAFALVRPPGHHATPTRGMGFCLLNSVATAARWAQSNAGIERVLIVDIDVHHGNGTQDAFFDDPTVLYFSIHQYPWYPGTGRLEEVGTGPGAGATINLPFPAGCGDDAYAAAFRRILTPAARRFRPNIIVVSVGYDAHWADPLAQMELSTSGYADLTSMLKQLAVELCGGKIVFALEGGYDPEALPASVQATLEVLLELPLSVDPVGKPPRSTPADFEAVLVRAESIHRLT